MKIGSFFLVVAMCLCLSNCQNVSIREDHGQQEKVQAAKVADNPSPREIYATNISFDIETGKIAYTLPEAALVRIRIGIAEGGPLLRNLLDWQERGPGEHVEVWDGKDSTGQLDLGNRKDLMMVLMCIPKDSQEPRPVFNGFKKSPQFYISFPDSTSRDDHGIPIVSGVTLVRIRLDEKDKTWLAEARYELKMFIDQVFFIEDEEGMNPFTYKLDTKMLNNGVHTITINLAVYDGEIGVENVLVAIKN